MFNKKMIWYINLLLILFSISCDQKKQSIGEFDLIHVFADSATYRNTLPALENIFNQFIYTPRMEKSFYLQWEPIEKLGIYQYERNLLFIGLFNQEDAASVYIMKMVSADLQKAIMDEKIFHIFQENLFAENQMSIILLAPNITQLMENINRYGDVIYREVEKYYFKRLEENMFSIEEQKEIEEYLADNFSWKIRIPFEYKLVRQSGDGSFIWLRKLRPDRNIFVYRFPTATINDSEDFLFNLRDSLTTVYFEGDSVVRENSYSVKTELSCWPSTKLIGVWKNNKYLVGGPYRMYTFFDQESQFQYVINLSVLAPDRRKKPYLDELEVIVNSFQLIPPGME